MPEALSSVMMGAMDWANMSAFRLFVAAPWPPRFRGAVRARLPTCRRTHTGAARCQKSQSAAPQSLARNGQ
jgi:hypothetical protein